MRGKQGAVDIDACIRETKTEVDKECFARKRADSRHEEREGRKSTSHVALNPYFVVS